jgi:serine protease
MAVSPTTGGEGTYTIEVDRSGLDDGVYTGTVEFSSNGGTAAVSVRMRVGSPFATGGDVGTVYVLLLDLEVFATVDQELATFAGDYTFNFTDVPPGEYGLYAGTDMNNDTYINDDGEAIGGYPTLLDPAILEVVQDRSGLTFNVAYQVNLQRPGAVADTVGAFPGPSDAFAGPADAFADPANGFAAGLPPLTRGD